MHNDIMPHFIRPEANRWQTVFFGGGGGLVKEKGKSWIKCKRIILNSPQNLVQMAVQNVKNQLRIFVRNAIV